MGELGAQFDARFEEGFLVIRKSNGVERRVDRDELRAAFRAMDQGATTDGMRLVTGNGPYLSSVRDDLGVGHGDYDPDEGNVEQALLLEAGRRMSRVAPGLDVRFEVSDSEPSTVDASVEADLVALFESERTEKEELVRETVRLRSAIAELERQLAESTLRVGSLELAVNQASNHADDHASGSTSRRDVTRDIVAAARATLMEIGPTQSPLVNHAERAVDLFGRDIGSAVSKCRVLLDEMVQQEWLSTFAAESIPPYRNFNDLARELDGQAGVDQSLLALKRTMYRLCNPGAHRLAAVPPRRGALILLTVVNIVATASAEQGLT